MSNATRQNLVLTENGLGIEIHGHKAGGVNELLDPGTDGTHGLLLVKKKKNKDFRWFSLAKKEVHGHFVEKIHRKRCSVSNMGCQHASTVNFP